MLLAVTIVFWLAALTRAWRWHRAPGSPALRAIAIALLAIAVALTLDLPTVQQALATGPLETGTPDNVADLGKQLAIITGAWACQSLLLHLTRGAEATADSERARAVLALGVGVVSTGIYLVPLIATASPAGAGIATPFITESRLLVMLYAGTVLFFVMLLCWTHTGGGALGSGVRVMGAGCGVMVAYAITRVLYFGAANYGDTELPGVYRLGTMLQMAGLGLIAVGTLIPRVARAVTDRRRRRAYTALEPLWELVTSRVPGVVFATTPTTDVTAWQLDRRVIEIQDGLVVLQSSLEDPAFATDEVSGEVAGAAARLAAALAASPHNARFVVGEAPTSDTRFQLITPPAGVSPVDWLVQVSHALPQHTGSARDSIEEHR